MVVREIRHAPRCKFCRCPNLAQVNETLLQVSQRKLSRDDAIRTLEDLGVEAPAAGDGWKNHWSSKGHYFHQSPGEAAKDAAREEKEQTVAQLLADEALNVIARILGPNWREEGVSPTPEQILEIQRVLYVHELELKLAAGLPPGISHDHVQKAISEGTKRRSSEAVAGLNDALAGAVGAVTAKALGQGEEQAALPPADFIVVDAREVEDDE